MNLEEAVKATMASLHALRQYHAQQQGGRRSETAVRTQQALLYREELFRSLLTRTAIFDKKMTNLINMVRQTERVISRTRF